MEDQAKKSQSQATSVEIKKPSTGGSSGSNKGSGGRHFSRKFRSARNNIRVHLPQIESYEKELEFPADGPGRVVVRLERLMGSDRVRMTDTRYMTTLLERLEEQERKIWAKRRFSRVKDERNRARQLVIDGLTEPPPDMQDLYAHPVFRVNRILQKLGKMDMNANLLTPPDQLPPIIEADPFLYEDSGKTFKYYPGHSEYQRSGPGRRLSRDSELRKYLRNEEVKVQTNQKRQSQMTLKEMQEEELAVDLLAPSSQAIVPLTDAERLADSEREGEEGEATEEEQEQEPTTASTAPPVQDYDEEEEYEMEDRAAMSDIKPSTGETSRLPLSSDIESGSKVERAVGFGEAKPVCEPTDLRCIDPKKFPTMEDMLVEYEIDKPDWELFKTFADCENKIST